MRNMSICKFEGENHLIRQMSGMSNDVDAVVCSGKGTPDFTCMGGWCTYLVNRRLLLSTLFRYIMKRMGSLGVI